MPPKTWSRAVVAFVAALQTFPENSSLPIWTAPDPLNVVLTRYPQPDFPIWKTRSLEVPTMAGPTEPRSVSVEFMYVHCDGAHQSRSPTVGESLKIVLPLSNDPEKPLPLVM